LVYFLPVLLGPHQEAGPPKLTSKPHADKMIDSVFIKCNIRDVKEIIFDFHVFLHRAAVRYLFIVTWQFPSTDSAGKAGGPREQETAGERVDWLSAVHLFACAVLPQMPIHPSGGTGVVATGTATVGLRLVYNCARG